LERRLSRAGYSVDLANDGEQGLIMWAAASYDVLLVDHEMPVYSGLEVIRTLASQGQLPPTIMVTGAGDERVAVEAMKLGAGDYVVKDADGGHLDLIPAVVEQLLQQRRLVEEKERAEEALRKAHDELEMRVKERTAELERANQTLSQEVAERERAEKATRASEERFRQLADLLPQTIFEVDLEGNLTYANRHGFEISGHTQEDIERGLSALELFCPEERERVQLDMQTMLSGGIVHDNQYRAQKTDGNTYPVLTYCAPIVREGDPAGLRWVAVDITGQVWAEEVLRDEEEMSRAQYKGVPVPTFTWQRKADHLVLVDYNDAADAITLGTVRGMVGKSAQEMLRDRPDVLEELWRCFRERTTIERELSYRFEPTGEEKQLAAKCAFVSPDLVLAHTEDITERVRAQEQLSRYAVELKRRNEEVRQLAYVISHDLRPPLGNIRGFAQELARAMEPIGSAIEAASPHLDEEQRSAAITALGTDVPEALEFIDYSLTRMDHLTGAVLQLARMGRRELRFERIDMNSLVEATLNTLAHQIEERQVEVRVGILPEVVADRTAMEQIMGNLLNNAVIYLDPARPAQIEVTGECNGDGSTFRVRDNGRGIAEKDMDKVFAPFRRAGEEDVPGEGMGLAYVQTLVRRHGGRIWCESEPRVGTTFFFTIERCTPDGANDTSAREGGAKAIHGAPEDHGVS
jgi:PAS domain S-box-containing protein